MSETTALLAANSSTTAFYSYLKLSIALIFFAGGLLSKNRGEYAGYSCDWS